jgi:hypothetical protein
VSRLGRRILVSGFRDFQLSITPLTMPSQEIACVIDVADNHREDDAEYDYKHVVQDWRV